MKKRLRALNPPPEGLDFLILSRLAVSTLLSGTCLFFLRHDTVIHYLMAAYGTSIVIFLLGPSLGRNLLPLSVIKLVLSFHVLLELGVEAFIVNRSGGIDSPFSLFIVLSIASAGLIYQLRTSMTAALVGGIFYVLSVIGNCLGKIVVFPTPANMRHFYDTSSGDFSALVLNLFLFLIIAFNVGYMAEKLHRKTRELSRTSDELKHIRLETEEIIEQMHSGLLSIDAQGMIVHFNKSAEEILGIEAKIAKGSRFSEVLTGGISGLGELLGECLERRLGQDRSEITITGKANRETPLGLSISPLLGEGGLFRGLVVQFADLSRVKTLEERVRLSDRLVALGHLSASIAHEIRNPLAAISGSVQVLSSELHLTGQNRRLMELVLRESSRLNQVLSGILQYSGIRVATLKEVELLPILEELFAIAREHPSYRQTIAHRMELKNRGLKIAAEQNQVRQLLLNLILNSQQAFDSQGGAIIITDGVVDTGFKYLPPSPFEETLKRISNFQERAFVEANNLAAVNVVDNGPGIPEEAIRKLFQPFYTTKSEGTGLGLAVVQRLAESLQAHLSLYSAPAEGTVFTVYFKNWQAQTEPPREFKSRPDKQAVPG